MKASNLFGAIDNDVLLEDKEAYKLTHQTCHRIWDSEGVNEKS